MMISNGQSANGYGKLIITCKNTQTSQVVFSGASAKFIIFPGAKNYNAQDFNPIAYENLSAGPASPANMVMPAGEYLVCYQLYFYENDAESLAAEDCVQTAIEPLTPLSLATPPDGDSLQNNLPVFTWLAPSPAEMFTNILYDIYVCEQKPGQSPSDAVERNNAVFFRTDLTGAFLTYPSSAYKFEKGKTYAWQVKARDANNYNARSEAWTFVVPGDSVVPKNLFSPFTRIGLKPQAPMVITNGIIKVEYQNDNSGAETRVDVVSLKQPEKILASFKMPIKLGQNFLSFDTKSKLSLKPGDTYEARFSNGNELMAIFRFFTK